jgi:HPt (histidine-containing phosphotransfer) domain-containing protein
MTTLPPGGHGTAGDDKRFEPEALAMIREIGDPGLVGELVETFAGYAPGRLDAARAHHAAGDIRATGRILHAVKSGAAQLGVLALAAACGRGERAARDGNAAAVAVALEDAATELPEALRWLRSEAGG